MKKNFLKKQITIFIVAGILISSAISCKSDIFFPLSASRALCYIIRWPVYSSREEVYSKISKQLEKENIHYVVLYDSKREYSSTATYFDNKGILLPTQGCTPIFQTQDTDTIPAIEVASLTEKDTIRLYDLIRNLTDKDNKAFNMDNLSAYNYVVFMDKIIGERCEKYTIDKTKHITNIDSVLFIFRARDSICNTLSQ